MTSYKAHNARFSRSFVARRVRRPRVTRRLIQRAEVRSGSSTVKHGLPKVAHSLIWSSACPSRRRKQNPLDRRRGDAPTGFPVELRGILTFGASASALWQNAPRGWESGEALELYVRCW
jgi:hypothetical protein